MLAVGAARSLALREQKCPLAACAAAPHPPCPLLPGRGLQGRPPAAIAGTATEVTAPFKSLLLTGRTWPVPRVALRGRGRGRAFPGAQICGSPGVSRHVAADGPAPAGSPSARSRGHSTSFGAGALAPRCRGLAGESLIFSKHEIKALLSTEISSRADSPCWGAAK